MGFTPTQYFEVGRGEMQANLSLISLRFYSKNATGPFAPCVRTLTSSVRGKAAFQKMDCAAPASFTHTRDIGDTHPPLTAKRGNWRRAKRRESQAFSQRAAPPASQRQLAEGVEFLEKYARL